MKKILVVFGTRPEAIKMAPLIKKIQEYPTSFELEICISGQHRELLNQVLDFFDIQANYNLNLMKANQNLFQLSADILTGMRLVFETSMPDFVFVHGDTTTSTFTALAAFYAKVKVCHVEAGLRTNNINSPFPEELNRQITSRIAAKHYAPTLTAKENLIAEGIPADSIWVTGNTVIDALLLAEKKLGSYINEEIEALMRILSPQKKIILVTSHRRENFGEGLSNICKAIEEVSQREDVIFVFPVHPNPNIGEMVKEYLGHLAHVHLVAPLSYAPFVWLMKNSYFILTDSGGIQEEAPSLAKPVLVMRNLTERPEAVKMGTVKLVGTNSDKLVFEMNKLLDDPVYYQGMINKNNPYGDGDASEKILNTLLI